MSPEDKVIGGGGPWNSAGAPLSAAVPARNPDGEPRFASDGGMWTPPETAREAVLRAKIVGLMGAVAEAERLRGVCAQLQDERDAARREVVELKDRLFGTPCQEIRLAEAERQAEEARAEAVRWLALLKKREAALDEIAALAEGFTKPRGEAT